MEGLGLKGPLKDSELDVRSGSGIHIREGVVIQLEAFDALRKKNPQVPIIEMTGNCIALPAFVDCHTHICFAGSRFRDFALRNSGSSYLEIARQGGGIWDSVTKTRKASKEALVQGIVTRATQLMFQGISTIEVKSGYGLDVENEIKMLEAIRSADRKTIPDLIPTCLAAHVKPKDSDISHQAYLEFMARELLPEVRQKNLSSRIDAFVEEEAFSVEMTNAYFKTAKELGFQLTVHADQFSTGGTQVAVESGALSADHLEASGEAEIKMMAKSEVIPVALPGASLGLGCGMTPARKLLDAGCSLAIASDWNPGSAPMGNLLTQASILATYEKLSTAEVLAALTFRSAAALGLTGLGRITEGKNAEVVVFELSDFREILYYQGQVLPNILIKKDKLLKINE